MSSTEVVCSVLLEVFFRDIRQASLRAQTFRNISAVAHSKV